MLDHGISKCCDNIASQNEILLNLRVTDIEISVLKSCCFISFPAVVDLERKLVVTAASEYCYLLGNNFDIARIKLGVLRASLSNDALYRDRGFLCDSLECLHHLSCLDNDLCCSVEITDNNESELCAYFTEVLEPA